MNRRFRVALSFAGEKRDYVAQVARLLANRFGEERILYDKFHRAEFALFDLGLRLPRLYGEESDLIVPVLCPAYDTKRWTGWEWVHIYSLLTREDGHRVMPSRFELAEVEGLTAAAGFIELDDTAPEQFAALILERLALNEGKARDFYRGAASSESSTTSTSITHNLPSLQPFFGREEELRIIAGAVAPESHTWGILVVGTGGLGKTSLAVRAAYDASDHFERVVFVSLKSRELADDGIRDLSSFLISGLAELFNELAWHTGHADITKAPDAQRPRKLLEALRGTRTLLVLDNLESLTKPDRDILFTFVQRLPQGCRAILTSRERFGSGTEELILEKLGEDAALATLARLGDHNPSLEATTDAERRALYRETDGNPLLLRWTAGQIGRGSSLTFDQALSHLRSRPAGGDPLEFVFGDLLEDFGEAELRASCALTFFTLPARVDHVAPLTGQPEADVDQALRSLVNLSLVVPRDEREAFTLVPLVGDFLRRAKPEPIAQVDGLLQDRAFDLLSENGGSSSARFPVIDAAWPLLSAALPRFLSGPNERLQKVCKAAREFLHFRGRWDEWLSLSRDAEARAEASGDFAAAGWRAYDRGWVHFLRRQAPEVLAFANRAAAHWKQAGKSPMDRTPALLLRGRGHRLAGDHDAAIVACSEAVAIIREAMPHSDKMVSALNALASSRHDKGDLEGAERDFREALSLAESLGDNNEMVSGLLGNLSELALGRGDSVTAEALARRALPLANLSNRLELVAAENERLARALVKNGKRAEALPYAQRAVEIFSQLGSSTLSEAQNTLRECQI